MPTAGDAASLVVADSEHIHDFSEPPPRSLVMCAECGAESPLWHDGAMVWLDQLPISRDLAAALSRWAAVAWESDDDGLRAEGRRLYDALAGELGPGYEIVLDDD